MIRFRIFGPFEIPEDEDGSIAKNTNSFWVKINKRRKNLSLARGVYVFGIRPSGTQKITPWYVGKTNRQNFQNECFKPHQQNIYHRALFKRRKRTKGTPVLFLIPRMTPGKKFYSGNTSKMIDFVENYLIGFGVVANSDIQNRAGTRPYRKIILPGFFNHRGRVGSSVKSLQAMFGLK